MKIQIFSLRERPNLIPLVFSNDLEEVWPEFMRHDATSELYFGRSVFFDYLDYAFGALLDGEIVGRAFGVPFAFNIEGRSELPDGGWDQVIRWAHEDRLVGRRPTTISALEIALVPKARGIGNALAMLDALKACAKKMGFAEMFAPCPAQPKATRLAEGNARVCHIAPCRRFANGHVVANSRPRRRQDIEDRSLLQDHRGVDAMDRGSLQLFGPGRGRGCIGTGTCIG